MRWMSPSSESSLVAMRCAASSSSRPPATASSRALMDFGRPTNNGTTMVGKTTMSRSGSSGTIRASRAGGSFGVVPPSSLLKKDISRLLGGLGFPLVDQQRRGALLDRLLAHDALFDVVGGGGLVHPAVLVLLR